MNIRNKKDFGAGIMYMVFGLFFALNALNYKMGTAAKMGPGYFPFWLGALLTALGFFVLLKSMSSKNTKEDIGTKVNEYRLRAAALMMPNDMAFIITPKQGN